MIFDPKEINILIIDDTPAALKALSQMLAEAGYQVRPANNGEMALRAASITLPDIILLDILMPGMDGFEVCKRLKSDVRTQDIPIIFISALSEIKDKVAAFKAGGVDYITKPFQIEEVLARVETHLTIRSYRLHLEKLVQMRTRELNEINRNLEKRVKEEVEENRRKDQLVFEQSRRTTMSELLMNIAHHWRQPLNAVGVISQEIKDAYEYGELTEEHLNRSVNTIMVQLTELSDIINTFRDIYYADKKRENFSISEALNKSVSIVMDYINRNNFTLNVDVLEDNIIKGNLNDFCQAIIKILINAIEIFIERRVKNGRIVISVKDISRRKRAIVTISDNGGGIEQELMEKVFDPYFTTKQKSVGTGLGLYLAKKIIENEMGGRLDVKNINEGAQFIIEI